MRAERLSFVCGLLSLLALAGPAGRAAAQETAAAGWRALPLIRDGAVDPAWTQIGYGGWSVAGGALRTDSDERGLGLLVYTRERFGDCRLRVVYRSDGAKSNSGVYVRLDDGILAQVGKNHPPGKRGPDGKLTPESLQHFKDGAAQELGAWYAVSHGYEVQICDTGDRFHRTGAVYSLAPSAALPEKKPEEWKTMVITLQGNKVLVDIDGQRISEFDPESPDVPPQKNWTEPRRETPRPTAGYIGLQTHDPGDVVYFREISVQPL